MCAMGGFLGAYALFLRGGNFGSASTGNLLECMIMIKERRPLEVLIRLGGGLLFALPFMISKWMELKTSLDRAKIILIGELAALIICAFIPADAHPVLALYPIFFISGFQWSVFGGTGKYGCSTIFISNNTRQCASSFAEYLITGNKEMRAKSAFYGKSILSFLLAGLLSALLAMHLGPVSALCGMVFPIAVLIIGKGQA